MESKKLRKILFIGNYPNPINENLYVFFKNIIYAIADEGVECHVISPVSYTKYRNSIHKIPEYKLEKTKNGSCVHIHYVRFFSASSKKICGFNTFMLTHRNYMSAALKKAKKINCEFDAVYGHFFLSGGLSAVRIGKKLDIPAFIAYGESNYKTQVTDKFRKITLKDIDGLAGIISVSGKNTDELRTKKVFEKIPIITCPNAIDFRLFCNPKKGNVRELWETNDNILTVGFVGSFSDRKGSNRLLEACKDIEGIQLAFAGSGDNKPQGKNVVFCDSVPHDKIGEFLSKIDIFVLPTLNEGCCNAILEAMAAGCAIVSSDLKFNDDILDSTNSIRVDPTNIAQIREAILKLKNDAHFRNMIANSAKNDSLKFSLEKRARKIISFINKYL